MPKLPLTVITRHVDIGNQFVRGVNRAIGYTGREMGPISRGAQDLRLTLDALLDEAVEPPEAPAPEAQEALDLLLVPQHRAQLEGMLSLATDIGGSWGVSWTDREGGDQGVRSGLHEATQSWSWNEWVLKGMRATYVAAGTVRDAAVEEVLVHVVDGGASLLVVEDDSDSLEALDDAPHRISGTQTQVSANPVNLSPPPPLLTPGAITESTRTNHLWNSEENPNTRPDWEALSSFRDRLRG